jgi:hypothetical protein
MAVKSKIKRAYQNLGHDAKRFVVGGIITTTMLFLLTALCLYPSLLLIPLMLLIVLTLAGFAWMLGDILCGEVKWLQ